MGVGGFGVVVGVGLKPDLQRPISQVVGRASARQTQLGLHLVQHGPYLGGLGQVKVWIAASALPPRNDGRGGSVLALFADPFQNGLDHPRGDAEVRLVQCLEYLSGRGDESSGLCHADDGGGS